MGDGYEQHFGLRARAFEPERNAGPRAPLAPEEVEPYLVARLRAVGWEGTPMLDLGLAPLLHEATGGVPDAIDRAMTALLEEAAAAGGTVISGDRLAAWLDSECPPEEEETAAGAAHGLAEAQLAAIEEAFAEHDRKLARLRRELAALREAAGGSAPSPLEDRVSELEARLDHQEAALRHVLEQLITFFEERCP